MVRKPWFCQDCRVSMIYDSKQDYYKCPECGTEVWPEADKVSKPTKEQAEIHSFMQQMAPTHFAKEALPAGGPLLGSGGSKSKGRSRKADMQKKSLAQINAGLAGKCTSFLLT